ncbi:MAG: hypothetical protein OXI50_06755 [Gammaproteobacteria bacterium]|nr:hypothetical protein [Gammaproteobacteria bacterium]
MGSEGEPNDISGIRRVWIFYYHPCLLVDLQRLDPAGMSTDSVVAALARFEQASSEGDLGEAVRALGQWAGQSAEPELVARLEAWINFDVRPRLGLTGPPIRFRTEASKGENMTTMLDRIDQRAILEGIPDPARIEAIADAVIESDSAEALIERAKEVAGS